MLGVGDHHAAGFASCSMDPPREATMAAVEVRDGTPRWGRHVGLGMGRGRHLYGSPLLRARAPAKEGDGGGLRAGWGFLGWVVEGYNRFER